MDAKSEYEERQERIRDLFIELHHLDPRHKCLEGASTVVSSTPILANKKCKLALSRLFSTGNRAVAELIGLFVVVIQE